jgi:3-isopropylmalate/(R)-2-methylmalate dehydratase small subunit
MVDTFTMERGRAIVLPAANIDTDIIIPQTELATITKSGLADGLFGRWRYVTDRIENPEFVLNRPANRSCRFLIAGANFGCGSSREHAVWALQEYGVRAVIASRFGEIFQRNSLRNGLLPALVTEPVWQEIVALSDADGGISDTVIDLAGRRIVAGGSSLSFQIDDQDRQRLLQGTDEIGETLGHRTAISAFVETDRARRPWIYGGRWAR